MPHKALGAYYSQPECLVQGVSEYSDTMLWDVCARNKSINNNPYFIDSRKGAVRAVAHVTTMIGKFRRQSANRRLGTWNTSGGEPEVKETKSYKPRDRIEDIVMMPPLVDCDLCLRARHNSIKTY
jgi:hypothetical protein